MSIKKEWAPEVKRCNKEKIGITVVIHQRIYKCIQFCGDNKAVQIFLNKHIK